ncbi:Thiamin pyrophosphokinase [hydrothermal vent metagenome]|uniref:Thiamin pyrophosphokinase n=1 Tax=hydrothermal vent metagenome TaxID=652676 RepID=A0A3B0TYR5_9ZZZZ
MQASFGDDNKTALIKTSGVLLIVGGGNVEMGLLKELKNAGTMVIAADGGANACARAKIVPDAIIGDMDSLDGRGDWEQKTRIIEITEQQTTDFEKCLYSSQAPLTIGLGLTGKRLDHTLAALDVMLRYGKERRIVLVDETDLAMLANSAFSFAVSPGDRVSIHPLERVVFTCSKGLKYPLDGLELAPGERSGTSNMATNGRFTIEPAPEEKGAWLLLLDKRHLAPLILKLTR